MSDSLLVYEACDYLGWGVMSIIGAAYEYAELPLTRKKRVEKFDTLYKHDIADDVVKDFCLDVVAGRADPIDIEADIIELEADHDDTWEDEYPWGTDWPGLS